MQGHKSWKKTNNKYNCIPVSVQYLLHSIVQWQSIPVYV